MGQSAPNPYDLQAQQQRDQANYGYLQGAIGRNNLGRMGRALETGLSNFDELAGRQIGSAALSLARSGNLTRIQSQLHDPAEVGVNLDDIEDPLDSIRSDLDEAQSQREQIFALTDEGWANPSGQTQDSLNERIDEINAQITALSGNDDSQAREEAEALREERDQLIADRDSNQESLAALREELAEELGLDSWDDVFDADGNLRVDAEIEHLEDQIQAVSDALEGVDLEENIRISQAAGFTAGSTRAALSRAVADLLYQREAMAAQGVSAIATGASQIAFAEDQAAAAATMAGQFESMANTYDFNNALSSILQFGLMAAGAVIGGFAGPGGSIAGASLGASLGGSTGSFLGNAFARSY